MAVATVPVALALYPVASRASGSLATIALAADLIGVVLAAAFSALLVVEAVKASDVATLKSSSQPAK